MIPLYCQFSDTPSLKLIENDRGKRSQSCLLKISRWYCIMFSHFCSLYAKTSTQINRCGPFGFHLDFFHLHWIYTVTIGIVTFGGPNSVVVQRNSDSFFSQGDSKKQLVYFLVGGWTNPFEKYARQIGFIFPRVQGENDKIFEFPPP